VTVFKHWIRLSGEVVLCPFLEMLKTQLDNLLLGNLL